MPSGCVVILPHAEHVFAPSAGQSWDIVASAPARVNLIGEHTDYNGGQVLPIGIERRTYVAVRALSSALSSRVVSQTEGTAGTFDMSNLVHTGQWWDYITGVAHTFRSMDLALPQVEMAIVSDIPAGAGLSSSAALEVATTLAFMHLAGTAFTSEEIATIAWRAETEWVGVPSGIMDQYASVSAQHNYAVHLWCDTLRMVPVPCHEHILIFDTGVPRTLRHSQFSQRRAECQSALKQLQQINPQLQYLVHATEEEVGNATLSQVERNRALHVIRENRRVEAVVDALEREHVIPGKLLLESHESLRTLYDCSSPELDWFVEHVIQEPGVRGARLTGAGWGGCAIATGELDALQAAAESLNSRYYARFGHTARTWLTCPASGARLEL